MDSVDISRLSSLKSFNWDELSGKTMYITGATGLIGSNLVEALLSCSSANIIVQIRNEEKARKLFGGRVKYVVNDLLVMPKFDDPIDYVVHCANPTSSKYFVSNPVETINTAITGTMNILEFAKNNKVKSFVYLSTMEVYGLPKKGHKIKEHECGCFDTSVIRNCYPLSKQLCENLCFSYSSEYGLDTKVVRLTQCFGPGVDYYDNRVFAEFARCAIENRNIILKTNGKTERSYLYITDAISAILTVLLKGKCGEVYTAANENTYCSILQMAHLVSDMYNIDVKIQEVDVKSLGYADTLYMKLDTSKLQSLGWRPEVKLKEAFEKLVISMKNDMACRKY